MQPDHFSVYRISSSLGYHPAWEAEGLDLDAERELIDSVASQPFTYLTTDPYWYGFLSQDQKYELKFFRMDHLLPKEGLQGFLCSLFEGYRFDLVDKRKNALDEIFTSLKVAFDTFRGQTTLSYIHFNKTRRLRKRVELIDATGRHFFVDLDGKEFLLHRHAAPLYPALLDLYKSGKDAELRKMMRSFFFLVSDRYRRGYVEDNFERGSQYGVIDGSPVLSQLELLIAQEALATPSSAHREIERAVEHMTEWMKEHSPEMIGILSEELASFSGYTILDPSFQRGSSLR